jgi:chemotaxis protein CheX
MQNLDHEKLVTTVRTATEEVFTMMLGINLETQPDRVEQNSSQPFDGVIALIGLAGSWTGSGRISCSAALACRLSGALLASEYTAVNEDVLDAMAEITNMIVGSVKSTLEEELGPMGLSIPTVLFGRNYRARSSGVHDWVVLPFQAEGEVLEVRLGLAPASKPDSAKHFALAELH